MPAPDLEKPDQREPGRYITRVHAKVNLALAVGRADSTTGMHPICSWMHSINLRDEIEIIRLGKNDDSCYAIGWGSIGDSEADDVPVEWDFKDDLSVRAHRLMEQAVERALPVKLRVSKWIPAGGGLGGGSADAAGVLIGINRLFELGLSHQELVGVALQLGSDIPFFLDEQQMYRDGIPRPAIVEGVGDQITRLDRVHDGQAITLFVPGFGCHTGEVYGVFDELYGADEKHVLDAQRVRRCAQSNPIDQELMFNDLAAPAQRVAPTLGRLKEQLSQSLDQPIHVSGSGSTLFSIGKPGDSAKRGDGVDASAIECSAICTQLC